MCVCMCTSFSVCQITLDVALQCKGQESAYTNKQMSTCTAVRTRKPAGVMSENGSLNFPLCLTGRMQESENVEKGCMKTRERTNQENHCEERKKRERRHTFSPLWRESRDEGMTQILYQTFQQASTASQENVKVQKRAKEKEKLQLIIFFSHSMGRRLH